MSTVETLEGLKRRIQIELDAAEINTEVEKRLKDVARRVKIDGFRPGKVPMKLVRSMHAEQIENDVVNDLLGKKYQEFMQENKEINPAGYPEIAPVEDKPYAFTAEFEVLPTFEIQGLDSLKAKKVTATVEESDIDNMIETLRKQQTTWESVERAAEKDDRVKINFVGSIDGVEFDGGKGNDVPLVLGSGSMIPGFEEGIIGMNKGETKVVDVTFPEEYQAESLKGKEAQFEITVTEIETPNLPEVNEDFAKLFGITEGGVEALRAELKTNMERELNNTIHTRFKNELMDALAEANKIDVPQALINSEVQNMARQSNFPEAQNQEQAAQIMEIALRSFGEEAEKRARLGLIVGQLITEKEIELEDKYVDARLESLAATYEDPQEVIEYFKSDENSMRSIRNIALEDQIVDLLAKDAVITEEKVSFDELMNPNR